MQRRWQRAAAVIAVVALSALLGAPAALAGASGPPGPACRNHYLTAHSNRVESDVTLVTCNGTLPTPRRTWTVHVGDVIAFDSIRPNTIPDPVSASTTHATIWGPAGLRVKALSVGTADVWFSHEYPCSASACVVLHLRIVA